MINWLWLAWFLSVVVSFGILEYMGINGIGGMKPLTHWLVQLVKEHGETVMLLFGGFVSWITYHVLKRVISEKYRLSREKDEQEDKPGV